MMRLSQQQNKESRSGLLQFLEEALNTNSITGLEWREREKKIWQLPWKHHRPTRWGDPDSFVLCAIGRHMYGFTGTEPAQEDLKNWKEKFRNALRSLGVKELEGLRNQEGDNPFKVYQFNNDPLGARKPRGRNRGETGAARRSNKQNELLNPQDVSCSSSSSDVLEPLFYEMPFRSRSPVHEFNDINTDGFSGNLDSVDPNIPHDLISANEETSNIPHNLFGGNNLNMVGATFRSYSSIPILSPLVKERRNIVEVNPDNCNKIFGDNNLLFTNHQHSNGHVVDNSLGQLLGDQMNLSGSLIGQNIPNLVCFNKENHLNDINSSTECMDGMVHSNNTLGPVINTKARYETNNVSGCGLNGAVNFELNNGAGHTIANASGHTITNGAGHSINNGGGLSVASGADYHMPSSLDMNIPQDPFFMNSFVEPGELNLPLMVLEVKYHDETALYESVTEETFRFCYVPNNRLREVITSCPTAEQFGPRDARLIELPSAHVCPSLNEQQLGVTQGILNNMERGVTIFYRDGDIYAKRLCKAVPFYYTPNEKRSEKLDRETEVKIFDFNGNFLKSGGTLQPYVILSFSVRNPERLKAPVLSVKVSHMLATQIKRSADVQRTVVSVPLEPECSLSNEFDTRLKIQQNLLSSL